MEKSILVASTCKSVFWYGITEKVLGYIQLDIIDDLLPLTSTVLIWWYSHDHVRKGFCYYKGKSRWRVFIYSLFQLNWCSTEIPVFSYATHINQMVMICICHDYRFLWYMPNLESTICNNLDVRKWNHSDMNIDERKWVQGHNHCGTITRIVLLFVANG